MCENSCNSEPQSHAIASTTARFALRRSSFVGNNLIGIAAKGNLVLQFFLDMELLHSHSNISCSVLYSAPSANHLISATRKRNLPQLKCII